MKRQFHYYPSLSTFATNANVWRMTDQSHPTISGGNGPLQLIMCIPGSRGIGGNNWGNVHEKESQINWTRLIFNFLTDRITNDNNYNLEYN